MRKLKLDPDALRVESFAAGPERASSGTVRAATGNIWLCLDDSASYVDCEPTCTGVCHSCRYTCPVVDTCEDTCGASCPVTCGVNTGCTGCNWSCKTDPGCC